MSEKTISRRDFPWATLEAGAAAGISAMPAGLTYAQEDAFLNYWTGRSGFEFDAMQAQVDQYNAEREKIFADVSVILE